MPAHQIPRTVLGEKLRQQKRALDALEQLRLRLEAPSDLKVAEDVLSIRVANLERELSLPSNDPAVRIDACERLVAAAVDLLAATVASDEGKANRYAVPMKSIPDMIDFFNEDFKVPVDMAITGWRNDGPGTPLDRWWQQLDFHLSQARHGVAMSQLGTTVYHEVSQSNQVPIVALLAHCLSLLVWLIEEDE